MGCVLTLQKIKSGVQIKTPMLGGSYLWDPSGPKAQVRDLCTPQISPDSHSNYLTFSLLAHSIALLWVCFWRRENPDLLSKRFQGMWRHNLRGSSCSCCPCVRFSARPPSGRHFRQCCLFILFRRSNEQRCEFMLIDGLWPMVWLDGQELGWKMVGKLVRKRSGEEIHDSLNEKTNPYRYMCPWECSPKGSLTFKRCMRI